MTRYLERVTRGRPTPIPSGSQPRCRDTVKLRGVPKASATAARRKAGRSTGLTTPGMVTAQKMPQWVIRSQALRPRASPPAPRVQFND